VLVETNLVDGLLHPELYMQYLHVDNLGWRTSPESVLVQVGSFRCISIPTWETKTLSKMIFLVQRWDMLVAWRVIHPCTAYAKRTK